MRMFSCLIVLFIRICLSAECKIDHCAECTSLSQCTKCIDGYGLDNGKCEQCPKTCETCDYYSGYGELTCTKCALGHYEGALRPGGEGSGFLTCLECNLEGGQVGCLRCTSYDNCEACFSNYYYDGKECHLCNENCATCENKADYYTKCNDEFYLDESTHTCGRCPTNCLHCDSNGCTECKDEYYPSGTGCEKCTDNCLKCDNSETCEICKTGFRKNGANKCERCDDNCEECNSTSCIICKSEFYVTSEGKYDKCADVCSACTGPSEQDCISCDPGYFFSKPNQNCFKCHKACSVCTGPNDGDCSSCSIGYYMSSDSKRCTKCEPGCNECESFRICKECKEGFYKHYINEKDTDCIECSTGCKKCEETNNHQCTECFPGYYETKTGNYVECTKCPSNCQNCHKEGESIICANCNDGYYPEGNNCVECNSPCSKCTSSSACTECEDGYLLEDNKCTTECDWPCLSCKDSKDHCTSCHYGNVLSGTTCIQCPYGCGICESSPSGDSTLCLRCQDGFYKDGDKCEQCNQACETCETGESTKCYSCAAGYYKYNELNYPIVYVGECKSCQEGDTNCLECTSTCLDDNIDKNTPCEFKCTRCKDGYYELNGRCAKCADGEYFDRDKGSCQKYIE